MTSLNQIGPAPAPPAIVDSILALVGGTPTVRLDRFRRGLSLESSFYLKLEQTNPGGSHKVRIAVNMVLDAERRGLLRRGSGQTIIEGTGGNTGLGLALAANLFGYRLVLVVPDNYSRRKIRLLEAYGAEVRLAESRRGRDAHFGLARELLRQNPGWFMPDQLVNAVNVETHARETGREIVEAFRGLDLDYFVAAAGSGGHLTGIGRTLKQAWPKLRVCLVEPEGCDYRRAVFVPHRIQAIAIGQVPANLDLGVVDRYLGVSDGEAVETVRSLMKWEAIGVGLSSGATLAGAVKLARETGAPDRILCLAYDHVADYLDEVMPAPSGREQ
ncbi:PLP-dependent cysteine synthase family protein [Phaeospirillum tilakii]|uniref:PLP-dependent cysteine synthase family protein n=1 Tax=Phaeospirillum tilakii TaxID=741673 RepID=A0ABW5CC51_9PROT